MALESFLGLLSSPIKWDNSHLPGLPHRALAERLGHSGPVNSTSFPSWLLLRKGPFQKQRKWHLAPGLGRRVVVLGWQLVGVRVNGCEGAPGLEEGLLRGRVVDSTGRGPLGP